MKNKNGFTLVELLAVIAILAILVIIALPNVMSLFNEAKQNSFTTELKEIAKQAEQQWMTDSMITTEARVYSKCDTCTGKKLNLSGRNNINYVIKLDKSGKIVQFKASDGTYQYQYNSNAGLKIENIGNVQQISKLQASEILTITPIGSGGGGSSELTLAELQSIQVLSSRGSASGGGGSCSVTVNFGLTADSSLLDKINTVYYQTYIYGASEFISDNDETDLNNHAGIIVSSSDRSNNFQTNAPIHYESDDAGQVYIKGFITLDSPSGERIELPQSGGISLGSC